MNTIALYLSEQERLACLRALHVMQRWVQGDVGVFAVMAADGFLRDKDGKNLSLTHWSTIVEPALTKLGQLCVGTTPGVVLDVHDPATHPVASMALALKERWMQASASNQWTTLAAMPQGLELHRTGDNAFDVYEQEYSVKGKGSVFLSSYTTLYMGQDLVYKSSVLRFSDLTQADVVEQFSVAKPVFKLELAHKDVHTFMRILDIYSRVMMNQWEYLTELTQDRGWDNRVSNWHEHVEQAVATFKEPWTGYCMHSSSGIRSEKGHSDMRVVWDVQRALRHWDTVQRLGYQRPGVSTDAPMRDEKWPLVDSTVSAGLDAIPVGGALIGAHDAFFVLDTYPFERAKPVKPLASSYSPVSVLDAVAYNAAHPAAIEPSF